MDPQEPAADRSQDQGQTSDAGAEAAEGSAGAPPPTVVLVIGMAGSGKTTLMQRLNSHLHMNDTPGFAINLDPAVLQVVSDIPSSSSPLPLPSPLLLIPSAMSDI